MKTVYVAFAMLGSLLFSHAHAQTNTAPLLAKQFKKSVGNCWVYTDENDNDYCVKPGPSHEVGTGEQRYLYALAVGDAYDYANKQARQAHADSGVVSMFVYQQVGKDWQLRNVRHGMHIGAYGMAPKDKDWGFHQFGPTTHGFMSLHSDMHHGYAGSHYMVLTPWQKSIANSWIGAYSNNEGAAEAGKGHTDISATLKINTTGKTTAGMYPLQATTIDNSFGKKRPAQTHTITFNVRKGEYLPAKSYPLNDLDY